MWEDQRSCLGSLGKPDWVGSNGRQAWSKVLGAEKATEHLKLSCEPEKYMVMTWMQCPLASDLQLEVSFGLQLPRFF